VLVLRALRVVSVRLFRIFAWNVGYRPVDNPEAFGREHAIQCFDFRSRLTAAMLFSKVVSLVSAIRIKVWDRMICNTPTVD